MGVVIPAGIPTIAAMGSGPDPISRVLQGRRTGLAVTKGPCSMSNHGTTPAAAFLGIPLRWIGPGAITVVVAVYGIFWYLARPAGEPLPRHVGQLFGGESVLLYSVALVLVSTLPHVEPVFGGIDHAAIWHRRAAMTATVLLLPHIELASNPEATSVGKTLAVVAISGLAALVVWAVLPRW